MQEQNRKRILKGIHPGRYPDEIKEQAVALFNSSRSDFKSDSACIKHINSLLGINTVETTRNWVKQSRIDAGDYEGFTSDEKEEMRRLRRENLELRRANGILKAA